MLSKLPALLLGAVVLVLGALFSVVLLGVFAVLGLGVWAWLWWKTRKLREAMRDASNKVEPGMERRGHVIDGEAIVVEEHLTATGKLPPAPRSGD